jgi:hypothetical protein
MFGQGSSELFKIARVTIFPIPMRKGIIREMEVRQIMDIRVIAAAALRKTPRMGIQRKKGGGEMENSIPYDTGWLHWNATFREHFNKQPLSHEWEDPTFLSTATPSKRTFISKDTTFDVSSRIWKVTTVRREFQTPSCVELFLSTWTRQFRKRFEQCVDTGRRIGDF